ncbi:MAG: DUF3465 domain-containing protein [Fibrobacteres bacterium]|nr:DUF3465 domain-containing protein [Fibrobacterota bacterium]
MMKAGRTLSFFVLLAGLVGIVSCEAGHAPPATEAEAVDVGVDSVLDREVTPVSVVADAFKNNTSNIQVLMKGTVTRVLADDVSGDKHQRFIITLSNKQTLLVAHNIDIGSRVPGPKLNTVIYVFGEYEWNADGGVVHWTHVDPGGTHPAGWIQYFGYRYQ